MVLSIEHSSWTPRPEVLGALLIPPSPPPKTENLSTPWGTGCCTPSPGHCHGMTKGMSSTAQAAGIAPGMPCCHGCIPRCPCRSSRGSSSPPRSPSPFPDTPQNRVGIAFSRLHSCRASNCSCLRTCKRIATTVNDNDNELINYTTHTKKNSKTTHKVKDGRQAHTAGRCTGEGTISPGDNFATHVIPKAPSAIHPNDCNNTTRHAPNRDSKIATHRHNKEGQYLQH